MNKRAGFVTIVGKPNSGKSTLMNALIGKKISIATPRKNTTRNQIKGILNTENAQIIFTDTPGFLRAESKLDERMHQVITNSIQGVDVIMFLLPFWYELDVDYLNTIQLLEDSSIKKYLILTKIDKAAKQSDLLEAVARFNDTEFFDKIIPISSTKAKNLDLLVEEITKDLPEDDIMYYDEGQVSESTDEFYAAEIVREKALFNLDQEVPHQLFVTIEVQKDTKDLKRLRAEIIVGRESIKGIIIGKGGSKLKKIGEQSRYDLEKYFGKKVFLEIFVKVKKDWQDKESIINEIEQYNEITQFEDEGF